MAWLGQTDACSRDKGFKNLIVHFFAIGLANLSEWVLWTICLKLKRLMGQKVILLALFVQKV